MNKRIILIEPSILNANFTILGEQIKAVEEGGAEWLHLDIMDGHFVHNISFGPDLVRRVNEITDIFLDVHLMIENPQEFITMFADAGANLITVHIESSHDVKQTLEQILAQGIKSGISLNPDTPVEHVEPYLSLADLVLVMSVFPGYGGQKFIPKSLDKVKQLRNIIDTSNYDTLIQIDGGIEDSIIQPVIEAGANILVIGTAIFSQKNISGAFRRLSQIATQI